MKQAMETMRSFKDAYMTAVGPRHPDVWANIVRQFIEWPQVPKDTQDHAVDWCRGNAENILKWASEKEMEPEIAELMAKSYERMQEMFVQRPLLAVSIEDLHYAYELLDDGIYSEDEGWAAQAAILAN